MNTIVLAHGLNGSPTVFAPMKAALEAKGYNVLAPQLPGNECLANARFLSALIAPLSPQCALVGYSLGGLSTRLVVKGAGNVARYISLDAPQHGIWWAGFLPWDQGGEAAVGSAMVNFLNSAPELPIPTLAVVNGSGMGDSGLLPGATVLRITAPHDQVPLVQQVIDTVVGFLA